MEKVNRQDELDLLDLFLRLVTVLRKNFWLIIIFFFVGTTLGLAFYYSSEKVYESKMIVSSTIVTRSIGKPLIDNINRHRREMNVVAIKDLLNISEGTASNLVHLNIESLSQIDDLKETEKFIITAEVKDQAVLPELQKGLIYYIENNDYVKTRVEQNKSALKQIIDKTDQEIKDLESLKEQLNNGGIFQNAKGNLMFDPTAFNTKIVELTKEKVTLQNDLQLVNSIHVIDGFSIFDKPSRPKLSLSLASGSFVGLLFVGVLIASKSIRKLLQMAGKQNTHDH